MRKLRILSVIIFAVSAGIFAYFHLVKKGLADTNGPAIRMEEESIEISAADGEEALLAGVTAEDKKDGDVSDSLVIERMSNFTERGRRTVTIAAFDNDSNVTRAAREVVYTDYTPPSFSLSAPLYFSQNESDFMAGLTVSDVLDGDLTQNIKMSVGDGVQMSAAGDYAVTFRVSNSAGDVAQLPVTVTIYDSAKVQALPAIHLTQYLIHAGVGESVDPWSYIDRVTYRGTDYRAEPDGMGGMVLAESMESAAEGTERKYLTNVEIANPVDVNTPGTYEITYRVYAGGDYENEPGTMRLIVVVDE